MGRRWICRGRTYRAGEGERKGLPFLFFYFKLHLSWQNAASIWFIQLYQEALAQINRNRLLKESELLLFVRFVGCDGFLLTGAEGTGTEDLPELLRVGLTFIWGSSHAAGV